MILYYSFKLLIISFNVLSFNTWISYSLKFYVFWGILFIQLVLLLFFYYIILIDVMEVQNFVWYLIYNLLATVLFVHVLCFLYSILHSVTAAGGHWVRTLTPLFKE